VETHKKALVVPVEAIYRDEEGENRVFVANGDSATAVPVKIGIETKDQAELLPGDEGGIKEGDTIILTGGYGLGDKAKIEVKAPDSKPDSKSDSDSDSKPDSKPDAKPDSKEP
jgi:multidrug efflux pump subunit AcrA (membrane-fusion protein)